MNQRPRAPTAVVHLVWQPAGWAPYQAFLDSYERHASGCEHELVLLYNGFEDAGTLAPYRERAADLRPREVVLQTRSLDLAAYAHAAAVLEHERLCILNSYSEVTTPGWLALLDRGLTDPDVGAAGASGSWASHLSYSLFQLGMPGPYAEAFDSRRASRVAMHELSGTPVPGAVRNWLYTLATSGWRLRGSARFPSPHLRTNGVLADRVLLGELLRGRADSKQATYHLESGSRSITAQLQARGRPPVVVDRHGTTRHAFDWHVGAGFFQADQRDLLITDNQTRSYTEASAAQRRVLSAFAWGSRARPA